MIAPDDLGQFASWTMKGSIRVSLLLYAASLLMMLESRTADWVAKSQRGRWMRLSWSMGLIAFLAHVAATFHYVHEWSHEDAVERTRQVSGFGEGIYFSYLFTFLWMVDVVWWNFAAESYADRTVYIGWLLHGYMLFMVFNATIVFESGTLRWTAVALLVALAWRWSKLRRSERPPPFVRNGV
ncbi:MAG: hypothetical protein KDA99_20550 [Planctomycetales bacterium]|nr:hypothetical protein [Planctomycetales bacterium]